MEKRRFTKAGLILLCVFALGCATTTQMLDERWSKLESAAFATGYNLGGILYSQTGKIESIDNEIVRIGGAASKAYDSLPNWELRSYLLIEARAKIDGLNAYRNDLEKRLEAAKP